MGFPKVKLSGWRSTVRGEAGGRCEKTEEDLGFPIAAPAASLLTSPETVVNPDAPLSSVHCRAGLAVPRSQCGQMHLGSACWASSRHATTNCAIFPRQLCEMQGTRCKFLAVQPHTSRGRAVGPVHGMEC